MGSTVFAGATAKEMFRLTKEVSAKSKDRIWPGFDPIAFTVLKENSLQFSPEPNNPESQIFMTLTSDYFAKYALEQNLAITVHEAFHGFQRSPSRPGMKWGYENAMLIFEYVGTSARNNALFAIEARELEAALLAKDVSEMGTHVRDFLLIRGERQRTLDPRFAEFERGAELNEGIAEYAGTKAVLEAFGTAAAKKTGMMFEAESAEKFLAGKYSVLKSINRIGSNVRRKFYFTGSAQALLLDRLLPGEWKNRVQYKGASLEELLREAVDPLGEVLRTKDYQAILALEKKAETERQAQNQLLLKETLEANGTKLTIDFADLEGSNFILGFDPMNATLIEPLVRVHTRYVKFGKNDRFSAVFNQAVVEDGKKNQYIAVIPGDLKIVADGVELDISKDQEIAFERVLRIVSENIEIEINAGTVTINKDEVRVHVAEK